jgi:hypothetical protein
MRPTDLSLETPALVSRTLLKNASVLRKEDAVYVTCAERSAVPLIVCLE